MSRRKLKIYRCYFKTCSTNTRIH